MQSIEPSNNQKWQTQQWKWFLNYVELECRLANNVIRLASRNGFIIFVE